MRRVTIALPISIIALICAGVLGNAAADTTTTTTPDPAETITTAAPQRTLTVTGSDSTSVRSDAGQSVFTASYRAQLTGALDDAATKATAIAAHAHVTLGTIRNIAETSATPDGDCDQYYASPMAASDVAAPSASGSAGVTKSAKPKTTTKTKSKSKTKTKAKHASAHEAAADEDDDVWPCEIQASVSVTYTLAG